MTTNNHPAHGPVSLDRLHQISEILSKAAAQSDGGNLGYAMADAVKVIDGVMAAFGAKLDENGLLPCPLCGGGAEFDYDDDNLNWISCSVCGISTDTVYHTDIDARDKLREVWNRRAAMLQSFGNSEQLDEVGSWNNHMNTPTANPAIDTGALLKHIEGMEVSVDVSTCDADAGHRYFGTVTEISELDTAKNGYILLVQDAKPNFKPAGNYPVIGFDLASEPDRSVEVHYLAPPGYVMVPKKLTAENGAKGVLSGEFSETKFINCPECFGDDECETCDGSGRIEITVPVTWTTIKAIWAKGVEHFTAAPQQEVKS